MTLTFCDHKIVGGPRQTSVAALGAAAHNFDLLTPRITEVIEGAAQDRVWAGSTLPLEQADSRHARRRLRAGAKRQNGHRNHER